MFRNRRICGPNLGMSGGPAPAGFYRTPSGRVFVLGVLEIWVKKWFRSASQTIPRKKSISTDRCSAPHDPSEPRSEPIGPNTAENPKKIMPRPSRPGPLQDFHAAYRACPRRRSQANPPSFRSPVFPFWPLSEIRHSPRPLVPTNRQTARNQ